MPPPCRRLNCARRKTGATGKRRDTHILAHSFTSQAHNGALRLPRCGLCAERLRRPPTRLMQDAKTQEPSKNQYPRRKRARRQASPKCQVNEVPRPLQLHTRYTLPTYSFRRAVLLIVLGTRRTCTTHHTPHARTRVIARNIQHAIFSSHARRSRAPPCLASRQARVSGSLCGSSSCLAARDGEVRRLRARAAAALRARRHAVRAQSHRVVPLARGAP